MRQLTISAAPNRFSKEWTPRGISWEELVGHLREPRRTAETAAEYRAMDKGRRAAVKDVGGFVGGSVRGRRLAGAVTSRSLVTLDIDYAQGGTVGEIRELLDGNAWALYSTHSHTTDSPRYRLVIPLDRDVTPDEYVAVARKVASLIGMDLFDDSTYEPHRLMYWPSCPSDGEYVFESEDGAPLRADGMLATYRDWRDPSQLPVSSRAGAVLRASGRKIEDPCEKKGIVGAFCRTYTIQQAIETFLPDVYEPTARDDRWTYKAGSTAGGLIVYEDKWAYSHHGTDPVGGREVNAFDLVRIHRFGELDEQTGEETRVTSLPSYKAMSELALSDDRVRVDAIAHSTRTSAEDDFGPVLPGEDPGNGRETAGDGEQGDPGWRKLLKVDRNGIPTAVPYNFELICKNDPGLAGTVRYDLFADRAALTRDLPWAKKTPDHPCWTDTDDEGLVCYISERYNLTGKTAIIGAHDLVVSQTSYHPVREYLSGLVWDGVERLDTMLVDYLGARDCTLNRAMTRKHMAAAVARIFKPGAKYDYALTLSGPEGIGKTTLIARLGMQWFDNSFSSGDIGDKSSMEQVRGRWLIELGELKDLKRNSNEAFKNFLTRETDKYRPAYGRKTVEIPRQCVFWATTNERCFLKGDTGNRRFWTVYVGEDLPVRDVFAMTQADIDQLWAEAVVRWKAGEPLVLPPELSAEAKAREEEANEISGDDRIGIIEAFLRRPLCAGWEDRTRQQRAEWFRLPAPRDEELTGEVYRRKYICAQEIACECFCRDMSRWETREIVQLLRRIPGLTEVGSIRVADKAYGGQRRFAITEEFWKSTE